MKLNTFENIKRAAVYVFYDKEGKVDDYVCYILNALRDVCCNIIVVANGDVDENGTEKLKKNSDCFIMRENKGYDITAYLCGLDHIFKNLKSEYDEVILLNSTLYGPFFPLDKMFCDMAQRDVDFWGLLKHYAVYDTSISSSKYDYIPEHIQSYFIVLRRSLLYSNDLKKYLASLPEIKNYNEARGKFEIEFTKDISEKGFKYDTYLDMSDYKDYSSNFIMWLPYELILKGCPFLKQKLFNFGSDILLSTTETKKAWDHINEKTNYDAGLIIKNILRTQNIADIINMLQIKYVLPSKEILENKEGKEIKIAALIDARNSSPDFDVFKNEDIFVIVNNDAALSDIKSDVKGIFRSEERFEDIVLKNLNEFSKDYDLICILPNIQEEDFKPYYDGFFYKKIVMENIAASENYVRNVISKFIQKPKLGLLVSPPYFCGQHEAVYPKGWDSCFVDVKTAAAKCGISVDINEKKQPVIAYRSALWARPQALTPLAGSENLKDFSLQTIERLYAFAAQSEGYLSGYLMTEENAAQVITSLTYMSDRFESLQNKFLKCKRTLKRMLPSGLIGKLLNMVGK